MFARPVIASWGKSACLLLFPALVLTVSCMNMEDPADVPLEVPDDSGENGGGDNEGPGDTPSENLWEKHIDINGDGQLHFCASCTDCHTMHGFTNLAFIRSSLTSPNSGDQDVVFLTREGTGSLADGDQTFDGICEVCHTTTDYHRNSTDGGHDHYPGNRCVRCHDHKFEFEPMIGVQSHMRHAGSETPADLGLSCDHCHANEAGLFQDGLPFTTTTICNECHSPGGMVDGVDDPAVGARPNWDSGLYQEGAIPAGKERWCGGCHDLGTSIIDGVSAPPVAGDNTWGFFATGHGRNNSLDCTDCHNVNAVHIDGVARSYSAALDNHQAAFRLSDVDGGPPLLVPRLLANRINPFDDPPYFDLCFQCHDRHALLGGPLAPVGPYYAPDMQTNFRNDSPMIIPDGLGTDISMFSISGVDAANSHYTHLRAGPPIIYDSDRDGVTESLVTCVTCHNVHGSSTAMMIRDGKLIGLEPSLNFSHVRYDRHDPPSGPVADWCLVRGTGS